MCDDSFDTLDDDVALIVGRIVLMKWKLARPVVTPAIRLANGSPPLEPERLARSYPASRTITIFIGPACLPWAALQATQRADRACSPSTDFIHAARQSARGRNLELDVAAVHARRLGEGTFGDSRRAGAQKSPAAILQMDKEPGGAFALPGQVGEVQQTESRNPVPIKTAHRGNRPGSIFGRMPEL